jgi:uncharacterized phage protein gp47/JayE
VTFVSVDFATDADQIADDAVDYLRSAMPGWEPADGNLEVWILQAVARQVAELTTVAADVPSAIFRQFGTQLVGLAPQAGARATLTSFWTARDNLGYTIPAGTQVAHRVTGDDLIVFEVADDTVITPGATTLSGVLLQATDIGTAWNGAPTGPLELVDALSWVESVEASTVSAGGLDAETDDAYLARLADDLRLLTPRPILPDDFATLARNVTGVYRALAINGYNPADSSSGNERFVTVVPIDATGAAVSSGVRANVVTYLDGLREVSFVVAATTPTYTTINVTYTIVVLPGYTPSEVKARCDAALAAFLSPAPGAAGTGRPRCG